MLPEDYVLHDDVMASLSPERRAKILAKSRKLFLELELRELRGKRRMTQKPADDAKAGGRDNGRQTALREAH